MNSLFGSAIKTATSKLKRIGLCDMPEHDATFERFLEMVFGLGLSLTRVARHSRLKMLSRKVFNSSQNLRRGSELLFRIGIVADSSIPKCDALKLTASMSE